MRRFYRRFRIRSLPVTLTYVRGSGKLPTKTKPKERTFGPPDHPPEDDRGYPASRRALVFVLLGPVIGAFASWSVVAITTGGPVDAYGIPPSYLFSRIVCAITGPVDGVLAYVTPIWLRAPLTAVVGAAVAVGVFLLLVVLLGIPGPMPPRLLSVILIVGAVATGMSSLFSHNYRAARF
jgi:hypothetical protein